MSQQTAIKLVDLLELTGQRIDLMRDRINQLEWCVAALVVLVLAQWLVMLLWSIGLVKVGAVNYDTWRQINGNGKP